MTGQEKSNRALIVLGLQERLLQPSEQSEVAGIQNIMPMVKGELQYFRERDRTVIFAISPANGPVIEQFAARSREITVHMPGLSAFYNTELEAILRELSISRLTLVGAQTNTAVLYTAADAVQRGFEVAVPKTCVWAKNKDDHEHALRQMREVLPKFDFCHQGKLSSET